MSYELRLPANLLRSIHGDLDRPHEFALERVGFLYCTRARGSDITLLLGGFYAPVDDADYLPSDEYGALVGAGGIRRAMERAYADKSCVIHVHRHEHRGVPRFSPADTATNDELIPAFWNVAPRAVHGAMVLSHDRARCALWDSDSRQPALAECVRSVGFHSEILS